MRIRTALLGAAFSIFACTAFAGEQKLLHCFTFTQLEDVDQDDWKAFFEATDELPEKIRGLEKVWYGKLRRPLRQFGRNAEEPTLRQWGVCMEMENEAALERYADNEAHAAWAEAYGKVRRPGTTTFDILGQ